MAALAVAAVRVSMQVTAKIQMVHDRKLCRISNSLPRNRFNDVYRAGADLAIRRSTNPGPAQCSRRIAIVSVAKNPPVALVMSINPPPIGGITKKNVAG